MKYCIFMPTTFVIDNNSHLFKSNQVEKNATRIQQYQKGINKLFELNSKYNIDIYIADNGYNFDNKISINEKINVIRNNPNRYGKYNKGAGIIEIWNNNKSLISKYDYIIHFEPRQLLLNNYFIDNFMNNPRTLFTYNVHNDIGKNYNTGLFCCKSIELLNFIENISARFLTEKHLSIEYVLYDFFNKNNIEYDVLDKMNLIWYDAVLQKEWYW